MADDDTLHQLLIRVYGIKCGNIVRLDGYDDRNYRLDQVENVANPNITIVPASGYILKISNPLEADIDLIDGQTSLMSHIRQAGVKCPSILPQIDGKLFSLQPIENMQLPVRLMDVMPGITAKKAACYTPRFYYQIGQLIAEFRNASESFFHPVYDRHSTTWGLANCPDVLLLLDALETEQKKQLISDVIGYFEATVLAQCDRFERGVLHADVNEGNILVTANPHLPGELNISALLDFGDCHKACFVFDLSIAVGYMMLEKSMVPLWDIAGYLLAGYQTTISSKSALSREELHSLFPSAAARVAQSLTLGCNSWRMNPVEENRYVLNTQETGWTLLEEMWRRRDDKDRILERWIEIAENFVYNE